MAHLAELPAERMLAVLSAGERSRAARIRHHEAWRQFVLTRGLLRMMLAHCTGAAPKTFAIEDGGDRAPYLADNPWNLSFNVSHSHDCVAVAVGEEALGVDIERIDQDSDWCALAEVCFHPQERAYLEALPHAERAEAFASIWTRKEARIKATGEGFRTDPSSFSTVPFDGPLRIEGGAAAGADWYTRPLAAPAGYKAAIACNDRSSTIAIIGAATILAKQAGLEQGLQIAAWSLRRREPSGGTAGKEGANVRKLSAYECTRRAGDQPGGLSTAVCLVLEPAHARHTMRVFQRDQRPGGVVHALPEGEADRLLALDGQSRAPVGDAEALAAAS